MGYADIKLETPEKYTSKFKNGKALIISSGSSTKEILPYKDKIKEYFDFVVVVNSAFKYFDDIADFHLMVEKVSPTAFNRLYLDLNAGNYRTDMPRFFNWKGIDNYDKRYNIHKLVRNSYDGKPNIRLYKDRDKEGLLVGPPNKRNMALGTVMLSAMHLSTIFGANDIYLIGADLVFKNEYDHFYEDKVYRDKKGQDFVKPANRVHVVDVMFKDKLHQTTDYFKDSAECIDNMITSVFKGVNIYDFSDGLITKAIPSKVSEFFAKKV